MEKRKSTRLTPSRTKKQLQPQNATVSLVSKAGVNETCFRILVSILLSLWWLYLNYTFLDQITIFYLLADHWSSRYTPNLGETNEKLYFWQAQCEEFENPLCCFPEWRNCFETERSWTACSCSLYRFFQIWDNIPSSRNFQASSFQPDFNFCFLPKCCPSSSCHLSLGVRCYRETEKGVQYSDHPYDLWGT